MLDMELTSSEHRGIMMLESEESAEARAPRAPRGCQPLTALSGRVGGDDPGPAVAPRSSQWPS